MAQVAMLWFHNPMTAIQRLSIRSFLHYGHEVTIFTYGEIEAPKGVKFADAGEILSEDKIFLSHDSFAAFSDVFRYKMLAETDYLWVDADTVCLRDDWDFGDYVFGYQEPFKVTNNVLGYPKDSTLAKRLVSEAQYEEGREYDALGPVLLTRIIAELGLGGQVQDQRVFNPLHWTEYALPYDPEKFNYLLGRIKGSHAVSLSNYLLKFHKFNREEFPPGSLLDFWNQIFR